MVKKIYEQRAIGIGVTLTKNIEQQTGKNYSGAIMDAIRRVFELSYLQSLAGRNDFKSRVTRLKRESFNNVLNQYILYHDK